MLGPNCAIAKDIKIVVLLLCQIRNINTTSRGKALTPNMCNSLPCIVRTTGQWPCNERVGCLLCSMARFNDLLDVSLDKCKVRGLVPCCCQEGYWAQVPRHPLDSYRYISHIKKQRELFLDLVQFMIKCCKKVNNRSFRLALDKSYISGMDFFNSRCSYLQKGSSLL